MNQPKIKTPAELVPARWWEAIDFIRLSLEIMRGVGDPWVEPILARPWALSSLLEYAYMLDNFFRLSNLFVMVSGERAGLISFKLREDFVYINALGLLPKFLKGGVGTQAADYIDDYRARHMCTWCVATVAAQNIPVHKLCAAYDGYLLGLSTTLLTLKAANPVDFSPAEFEVKELNKTAAQEAWRRWRLYEVEQKAGSNVLHVADQLLEALPAGKYMALYHKGEEVGLAMAHQIEGEWDIGLFPSKAFWASAPTANLVKVIGRHLSLDIRRLTVTQTHADSLTACESLDFERHVEKERHLVVFKRM